MLICAWKECMYFLSCSLDLWTKYVCNWSPDVLLFLGFFFQAAFTSLFKAAFSRLFFPGCFCQAYSIVFPNWFFEASFSKLFPGCFFQVAFSKLIFQTFPNFCPGCSFQAFQAAFSRLLLPSFSHAFSTLFTGCFIQETRVRNHILQDCTGTAAYRSVTCSIRFAWCRPACCAPTVDSRYVNQNDP